MKCLKALGAGFVGLLGSAPAYAAIDLPETIAVTDVETLAGVVLAALAAIWIVRKLIKLTNRS